MTAYKCGCLIAQLTPKRKLQDNGVSAILGTMLMMAIMMTMLPAAIQMSNEGKALAEARADESRAEREQAENAAWCARHALYDGPECERIDRLIPPGYSCEFTTNIGICERAERALHVVPGE